LILLSFLTRLNEPMVGASMERYCPDLTSGIS
jgi:hypothetical protein